MEFELEELMRKRREQEHQEYYEEMKQIRNLELLESVRKFTDQKKDELLDVSIEIDQMEQSIEDEYDLFENNAQRNAFNAAKKKFN